jgi:hypothetical protein
MNNLQWLDEVKFNEQGLVPAIADCSCGLHPNFVQINKLQFQLQGIVYGIRLE